METVLGDYLEAVCVERLDAVSGSLANLATGRLTLVEGGDATASAPQASLAARVRGPAVTVAALSNVRTADSLAQALRGARRARRRGVPHHPRGRVGGP